MIVPLRTEEEESQKPEGKRRPADRTQDETRRDANRQKNVPSHRLACTSIMPVHPCDFVNEVGDRSGSDVGRSGADPEVGRSGITSNPLLVPLLTQHLRRTEEVGSGSHHFLMMIRGMRPRLEFKTNPRKMVRFLVGGLSSSAAKARPPVVPAPYHCI